MKKTIKWSSKIEKFIVEAMIDEKLWPEQVIKKYQDKLPATRTYYRKYKDNAEFRQQVNAAYEIIFDDLIIQLEEITTMTALAALKTYGNPLSDEELDFKSAAEFKKSRIDALKFSLGKLAGILTRKYNVKQTVEHTGQLESQFTFVLPNYADNKMIDITPDTEE